MKQFCYVCHAPVTVDDDFNPEKQKATCGVKCSVIEGIFLLYWSDEAIHLRQKKEDYDDYS